MNGWLIPAFSYWGAKTFFKKGIITPGDNYV